MNQPQVVLLYQKMFMYESTRPAIKYHRLGSLNSKFIFSQFWKPEVQDEGAGSGKVGGRGSLSPAETALLGSWKAMSSHHPPSALVCAQGSPSYQDTISCWISSHPNDLT